MLFCLLSKAETINEDEISEEELTRLMLTNPNDPRVLKAKVNSVARLRRMYKNLRENSDLLLKIKMANDGRIPQGLLLEGKPAIRNALKEFQLASMLDKDNEKRPSPKQA